MLKIRKKELAKNLILLLIVLIICFIFLEITLRVCGIGVVNKESNSYFIKHSDYNPFLIFGPNINQEYLQTNGEIVYWNSQGFRMKEDLSLEKDSNEYRIISLGGSTTENLPNGMNLHYPEETCKILNQFYSFNKKINCVNSGKSAYTTAHSLIRLQFDLLQFNPDMITIMHNINDLGVNLFPSDDKSNYANKYLFGYYAQRFNVDYLEKLIRKESVVINNFYRLIGRVNRELFVDKIETKQGKTIFTTVRFSEEPVELKYEGSFKNNLIAIAEIAKAHNITVVFLSQPAIFTDEKIALGMGHAEYNDVILWPKKDDFKEMFEEYNQVIKDVAKEENVFFIDMYNLFSHDEKYFTDVCHYTPEGIIRFGEIFSDELSKILEPELGSEQQQNFTWPKNIYSLQVDQFR